MLRRASTFLSALAIALAAENARGQACCTGAGAVTPARLAMHEDGLAGMTLRGAGAYGSFASNGTFVASPSSASEQDFEQDVFAALRVASSVQIATLVPIVETRRALQGTTEVGGGLGDILLTARWDVITARRLPGLAFLGGVIVPTGKPPDLSDKPMATDATGLGAFGGTAGFALEQFAGPWLFNLIGTVTVRAPRSVHGVDAMLAPQWSAAFATTYVWKSGAGLALIATYVGETDAWVGGATAPNSGRRDPQLALAYVMPFADRWRFQAMAFVHPPLLGQNTMATAGASTTLTRVWW